jgi:hypothetical protein
MSDDLDARHPIIDMDSDGSTAHTVEVRIDGVPRVGIVNDDDDLGDPTVVLWAENGDAVLSLPLRRWLAGEVTAAELDALDAATGLFRGVR